MNNARESLLPFFQNNVKLIKKTLKQHKVINLDLSKIIF